MCMMKSKNSLTKEQQEFWSALKLPLKQTCDNCKYGPDSDMCWRTARTLCKGFERLHTPSVGPHDPSKVGVLNRTHDGREYGDFWEWDDETYE